jgi:hypothetical protein
VGESVEIVVRLRVEPEDADPRHGTGLQASAFDRLDQALLGAGFEIVSGPHLHQTETGRAQSTG